MAEKLSVQIALEGGKEVERQLADLGEAGQKAFQDISKAAEEVGGFDKIDPGEVTRKLEELGLEGEAAFNKIKTAVEQAADFKRITGAVAETETKFKAMGDAGAEAFNRIKTAADQTDVQRFIAAIGEVEAKLAAMGETGKKAFGEIGEAAKSIAGLGDQVAGETGKGSDGLQDMAAVAILLGKNLGTLWASLLTFVRGLGPLGIAAAGVATALGAMVLAAIKAEQELAKLTEEAGKFGLNVEKFNAVKESLTSLGISGDAASAGLAKIQGVIDQVNVDKVNRAIQQLKDISQGLVVQGNPLLVLQEAAKGVGEAATIARQKLQELGVPLPDTIAQQLRNIITEAGSVEAAIPKLIEKLKAIPDSLERTQAASAVLGEKLASELLRAVEPATAVEAALNRLKIAFDELVGTPFPAPPAAEVVRELDAAASLLKDLKKQIDDTGKDLDKLDEFTFGNLSKGFDAAVEKIKKLWEVIKKEFSGEAMAAELPPEAAARPAEEAPPVDTAAAEALKTALQEVQASIEQINQSIASIDFSAVDASPLEAIKTVIEEIKTSIETISAIDFSAVDASPLEAIKTVIEEIQASVEKLVAAVSAITWETVTSGAAEWQKLKTEIEAATAALAEFNAQKGAGGSVPATGGGAGGQAAGGLLGGRGSGTSDSNLAWVSRGEYIIPARAVSQPGVLAFLEALRRSGDLQRALGAIGQFASGGIVGGIPRYASGGATGGTAASSVLATLADRIARFADSTIGSVEAFEKSLIGKMEPLFQKTYDIQKSLQRATQSMTGNMERLLETLQRGLQSAIQSNIASMQRIFENMGKFRDEIQRATATMLEALQKITDKVATDAVRLIDSVKIDRGGGLAGGGRVGGRGSGTSDSNLAWLSRGEYVTPARAVSQPGVLAFLEALRRSGGNLRAVLDGMGRFALGGLVSMPPLAIAGIGASSNVTIQFPGLAPISGLRASSDVVEELKRAAVLAQVRSGGRKPSRYS